MTTEPSKEAQFKQRFISVLADLKQNGVSDPEAMELVGSLAAELSDALKQKSWVAVKQSMTYAIQLLSVSLVAFTQRNDADIAAGEKLVDQLIDRAATHYRQTRTRH